VPKESLFVSKSFKLYEVYNFFEPSSRDDKDYPLTTSFSASAFLSSFSFLVERPLNLASYKF
jgi:hypothetical protein